MADRIHVLYPAREPEPPDPRTEPLKIAMRAIRGLASELADLADELRDCFSPNGSGRLRREAEQITRDIEALADDMHGTARAIEFDVELMTDDPP